MIDTITDWVEIGMECLLSAALITFLGVMMILGNDANNSVANQQLMHEQIQEYRKYNQYDNTVVYSQDVVSAIYAGRGIPEIRVSSTTGNRVWSESTLESEFTASNISDAIDMSVKYNATLIRSENGEVTAIVFNAIN